MSNQVRFHVPGVAGNLSVVYDRENQDIWTESAKSLSIEEYLRGRNPLDAIQLTQQLSSVNGVAHALAATLALEDIAGITPTKTGQQLRELILQLSTIYAHISHFYFCFITDYLNREHAAGLEISSTFMEQWAKNQVTKGDLPLVTGKEIAANIPQASNALYEIQRVITMLTGKFPVVMNIIPGGVTNHKLSRDKVMTMIRRLEGVRGFIETIWSQDVKKLIQKLPETMLVFGGQAKLISFGSLGFGKEKRNSFYSPGVYVDGKQEPLNELKIYELLNHTYYEEGTEKNRPVKVNPDKPEARTWIKSARYDTEALQTGVLPRILVTHFAGGNPEISDTIVQIMEDLNLTFEQSDCIASRLLAQVFEGRIFLKEIFAFLIELDVNQELNSVDSLKMPDQGVGLGRLEGPTGSILHQVFIDDGKIENYRIISPGNWNASTLDEYAKTGVIEASLKQLIKMNRLGGKNVNRLLHSYNLQVLEATQ